MIPAVDDPRRGFRIFRLSNSGGRTTVLRSLVAKQHHREMLYRQIVYEEYANPMKVISLIEQTLPDKLDDKQVLVKMIVAPVNPANINTIQAVYPVKLSLPPTGGFEGIRGLLAAGSCFKNLCLGDRVIPVDVMGT